MVAADDAPSYARKLGIQRDQVVQEWGWDEDTDDDVRAAVEEACGSELLDEDTDEVVDVVLLWWRDGDGDLVDTLMDAISPLAKTLYAATPLPQTNDNPLVNSNFNAVNTTYGSGQFGRPRHWSGQRPFQSIGWVNGTHPNRPAFQLAVI